MYLYTSFAFKTSRNDFLQWGYKKNFRNIIPIETFKSDTTAK